MYDLAMTIYFGMYGATMTTNSELFWGPDSIMMLPYMSSAGDAQSAFFQRMTGFGFAIMSLGYAKCGVSKDAWIKQTMIFHVGTCVEIELPELPGQRRVDGMGRLKFDFHTGRLDSDLLPPVRER